MVNTFKCGRGLAPDKALKSAYNLGSDLLVELAAFLLEPLRLFGQALGHFHIYRIDALVGRVFTHFLGDFHRAELRPAHRTEMRDLGRVLRQGFVVIRACGIRVEARLNWSSQRNSKRALLSALSRICAPGCPFAR